MNTFSEQALGVPVTEPALAIEEEITKDPPVGDPPADQGKANTPAKTTKEQS